MFLFGGDLNVVTVCRGGQDRPDNRAESAVAGLLVPFFRAGGRMTTYWCFLVGATHNHAFLRKIGEAAGSYR